MVAWVKHTTPILSRIGATIHYSAQTRTMHAGAELMDTFCNRVWCIGLLPPSLTRLVPAVPVVRIRSVVREGPPPRKISLSQ